MLLTPQKLNISMMDGSKSERNVMTFKVSTKEGVRVSLMVQKVSNNLCIVMHRRTGAKVSEEITNRPVDAAIGFEECVKQGVYDLDAIHRAALHLNTVNELPAGVYA